MYWATALSSPRLSTKRRTKPDWIHLQPLKLNEERQQCHDHHHPREIHAAFQPIAQLVGEFPKSQLVALLVASFFPSIKRCWCYFIVKPIVLPKHYGRSKGTLLLSSPIAFLSASSKCCFQNMHFFSSSPLSVATQAIHQRQRVHHEQHKGDCILMRLH